MELTDCLKMTFSGSTNSPILFIKPLIQTFVHQAWGGNRRRLGPTWLSLRCRSRGSSTREWHPQARWADLPVHAVRHIHTRIALRNALSKTLFEGCAYSGSTQETKSSSRGAFLQIIVPTLCTIKVSGSKRQERNRSEPPLKGSPRGTNLKGLNSLFIRFFACNVFK
jgi:hypothetical protein